MSIHKDYHLQLLESCSDDGPTQDRLEYLLSGPDRVHLTYNLNTDRAALMARLQASAQSEEHQPIAA